MRRRRLMPRGPDAHAVLQATQNVFPCAECVCLRATSHCSVWFVIIVLVQHAVVSLYKVFTKTHLCYKG